MPIQGIIRPPPEIRAVANRTALYVSKNGRAFETKILSSSKGQTPKFAFLHATSPFHAYYQDRIVFYDNGGTDDAEEEKEAEPAEEKKEPENGTNNDDSNTSRQASVVDPVVKALLDQRSVITKFRKQAEREQQEQNTAEGDETPAPVVIPPPPKLHFVNLVVPSSLTNLQIETIKLVAQYTALSGANSFLPMLSHREWNNPEFAFCQPRHAHFAYFTALVDAYKRVLDVWQNEREDDLIPKLADNPMEVLKVAAYRAEYERDSRQTGDDEDDDIANVDWHNFVVVETIDFPVNEKVELSLPPPPPPPVQPDVQISDDEDETIRVVGSYQPKVAASATTDSAVIDPITGKSINIQDMSEHMRIQLLDPKWAEQRKIFQDKQRDSNLVGDEAVAANLERLTKARNQVCSIVRLIPKTNPLNQQESALAAEANSKYDTPSRASVASGVGPSLPQAPGAKRAAPSLPEPVDTKRPRVETTAANLLPPPPPPPMMVPAAAAMAVPQDPFAAAAAGPANDETEIAEGDLISAAAFAASLSSPEVRLQVRIPNDVTQTAWNFRGQIINTTADVMDTVKAIKSELSKGHLNDMPVNKMQLKNLVTKSFLKDSQSLAAQNVGPVAQLELVLRVRSRGRRK